MAKLEGVRLAKNLCNTVLVGGRVREVEEKEEGQEQTAERHKVEEQDRAQEQKVDDKDRMVG